MSQAQHLTDELFSDHAMHLLQGDHARKAVQHIASCALCEKRFREIAGHWEHSAVRVDELLRHKPVVDDDRVARSGWWARFTAVFATPSSRWAASAAVVAALLVMIVPRLIDSPDPASLTKLPAMTPDVLPRTVLPGGDNEAMLRGFDAYMREDFKGAIAALENMETTGPADALRRVYLASAFAWTGQHEKAIDTLEEVPLDAVPDPWSAEAHWTLYLSLRETGQDDRAQSVLRKLGKTPGDTGDRARAIIEKQSPR